MSSSSDERKRHISGQLIPVALFVLGGAGALFMSSAGKPGIGQLFVGIIGLASLAGILSIFVGGMGMAGKKSVAGYSPYDLQVKFLLLSTVCVAVGAFFYFSATSPGTDNSSPEHQTASKVTKEIPMSETKAPVVPNQKESGAD